MLATLVLLLVLILIGLALIHRKPRPTFSVHDSMPNNYAFRVRVDRSPTDTIECADAEIPLGDTRGAVSVVLRNKTPGQPIKEAQHFALVGSGYASESEAKEAGEFYEVMLMIALARVRVGADFGYRAAKGVVTKEGLKWLEQQHGERVLHDVQGLMVYQAEPRPKFALSKANMLRGASRESFLQAFNGAVVARPTLTEREGLAFSLFNASFFQPTADSRFLLLVMSIEALLELSPRSIDSQSHVKSLIASTKAASLPPGEKESMLGSIRWLAKESINQAGRREVTSRLGDRQYDGRAAADFFTHVYHMRSNLVHGNMPYPTFDMVGAVAAPLEVFVSELLTVPVLGVPS